MQFLSQIFNLRMALVDRALQDLDFGFIAANRILKLNLQAKFIRFELVILVGLLRNGLEKLIDKVDRGRLGQRRESSLRDRIMR